jgi:glycosyltransferase involved in cell wall biosynthesis
MKVVFPIHIDRWRSPIASLLREIAVFNEDIEFYSFSSPETGEDHERAAAFWDRPNIHKLDRGQFGAHRFDVAHTASATMANLSAIVLAKIRSRFRCKYLYTANSEPLKGDPFFYHYLASLRIADKICCVSRAVDRAIRPFGRKGDAVIPNGFDPMLFNPGAAQTITLEKYRLHTPFFLFCGVIQKRKRPDIFIDLAERMPQFQFVVAGGYHFLREAEPFLLRMDTVENITSLGKVTRTELRDLMGHATALVFPSESEGLPLSVVEASGMGLPVLAQPVSSLPEVIAEGTNGWLISIRNLDLWMEKLSEIAKWRAADRRAFAEKARNAAIATYSWEKIARQYGEMYRNIMAS